MSQLILILIASVFFTSCASQKSKTFLDTFEDNKVYHKHLGKTESTKLLNGLADRAVFTATYLYTPIEDKNDTRDEQFIVSFYFNDEEFLFDEGDFNLTLRSTLSVKKKAKAKDKAKIKVKKEKEQNKKKTLVYAKNVKHLSSTDKHLKDISFVAPWQEYYLVTFPHLESKQLYLMFKSDYYGEGYLYFSKVSKYTLTKEAF